MADPHDEPHKGDAGVPPETSVSLLERLRAGEPEAWERMAALYYPWVSARLQGRFRRWKWPTADVVDVVQEVFLAVKKGLPGFRRQGARGHLSRLDLGHRPVQTPRPRSASDAGAEPRSERCASCAKRR